MSKVAVALRRAWAHRGQVTPLQWKVLRSVDHYGHVYQPLVEAYAVAKAKASPDGFERSLSPIVLLAVPGRKSSRTSEHRSHGFCAPSTISK